jgi:hypothetical protein
VTSYSRTDELHVDVYLLPMAFVSVLIVHIHKQSHMSITYRDVLRRIAFKREFNFPDVIRLWDVSPLQPNSHTLDYPAKSAYIYSQVLFTNYYSESFEQFVALAVLHSHRDVIIRYLVEFDECLKYCNQLTGTVRRVPNPHFSVRRDVLTTRQRSLSFRLIWSLPWPKLKCSSCPSGEWWKRSIETNWSALVKLNSKNKTLSAKEEAASARSDRSRRGI